MANYYVGEAFAPKPNMPAHLGVNILVIWDGKLLLEQRRDCGLWGLPGGGVRRGEALEQAIRRELWEESGILAEPEALLPLRFYDEPARIAAYPDGSVWKMYIKLFLLYLQDAPQLKASPESTALRFFSRQELSSAALVPTHQALIRDYSKLLTPPSEQTALAYLQRNIWHNIDMIEPIRRGHAQLLYAGDDGVLLRERKGNTPMLSVDTPELAGALLPMVAGAENLVVHHAYEKAAAERLLQLHSYTPCYQVAYPGTAQLPVWGQIRRLDKAQLPVFLEHYAFAYHDPVYGQQLLDNGVYGQFIDGVLAGFIGTHLEGAMGMLEVFPAYRRQGIGQNLMHFMINYWHGRNCVPFAHIICSNQNSLRLQKKCGAVFAEDKICWMGR